MSTNSGEEKVPSGKNTTFFHLFLRRLRYILVSRHHCEPPRSVHCIGHSASQTNKTTCNKFLDVKHLQNRCLDNMKMSSHFFRRGFDRYENTNTLFNETVQCVLLSLWLSALWRSVMPQHHTTIHKL